MIRMRDDTRRSRSVAPFGGGQGEELDPAAVEIEDGGGRRSVDPSAGLARIHDERLATVLHFLPMQMAMDHDFMGFDRSVRDVREVVGEQDAPAADLEAVRGFEELQS